MRVYLPTTSNGLLRLADGGIVVGATPGADLTGFAVTPGLRHWYGEDLGPADDPPDDEDLEYAACAEAARASLRLLGTDPAAVRRRVVLAADVDDAAVTVRDDLDRGVVRVTSPVRAAAVAAVFVDDAEAEMAVAAATEAIDAADLGDPAAQEITDDAEGFELSWFAATELAALASELGAPAAD